MHVAGRSTVHCNLWQGPAQSFGATPRIERLRNADLEVAAFIHTISILSELESLFTAPPQRRPSQNACESSSRGVADLPLVTDSQATNVIACWWLKGFRKQVSTAGVDTWAGFHHPPTGTSDGGLDLAASVITLLFLTLRLLSLRIIPSAFDLIFLSLARDK